MKGSSRGYSFIVDKKQKKKMLYKKTQPQWPTFNSEVSPPKIPESLKMTPTASDQLFNI